MKSSQSAKLNTLLREQRLLRGWSLQQLAEHLCQLGEGEGCLLGISADMVGKWERGEKRPSLFYQEKLCQIYNTTTDKLGLLERHTTHKPITEPTPSSKQSSAPTYMPSVVGQPITHVSLDAIQATHTFLHDEQVTLEGLESTLLSLSSKQLAYLTTMGWTLQDVLTALQAILQGEAVMAKIQRRQVLQLGAGLILGSITFPTHEHHSTEERVQITQSLGESIAISWSLFQSANPTQVLAIAQSQLALVQRAYHILYPNVRPLYYSAIYRLIGAALHFQGRYDEARIAHEKSYITALEDGNVWNIAQCLSWQAYGQKAQRQYAEAIETAQAALRIISLQKDTESIRLRARLLAFNAENAALLGKNVETEMDLAASEILLQQLPGNHEEFDRIHWLQQAGLCALHLKQFETAARHLQQAFDELPPQWILRSISTALPLASTFIRLGEKEQALAIARSILPLAQIVQAPTLNQEYLRYLHKEFLISFPGNKDCQMLVNEAYRQLILI